MIPSNTPNNENEGKDNSSNIYGTIKTVGNSTNIAWHKTEISRSDINQQNNHKSAVIWFTGLSGSGKSTLANAVHSQLFSKRIHSYILDGDNVRHGLCQDLGFTPKDREENIRRVGHVASLFVDAGFIVLTAFVSPFKADRDKVRQLVADGDFIEVYCKADLNVCETRDTKGLYSKARQGVIPDFTGISSPYEEPTSAELVVETGTKSLEGCVDQVLCYLYEKKIIPNI